MNIITNLNELITKNFNKFLKNYFNNMNYVDKQGTFSNYYNFVNDLDLFLDLPKRKHFDPFVCAEICEQAATESYSKTGKIITNKIGKRTSNNININRTTTRNIILAFDPKHNEINDPNV